MSKGILGSLLIASYLISKKNIRNNCKIIKFIFILLYLLQNSSLIIILLTLFK